MMTRRTRRIAGVASALLAVTALAWAFWTATGGGSASLSAASLSAAALDVPSSASNSVTVTWTAQASLQPDVGENASITYSVERARNGGAWAAVSSGDCSGAKPHGTTTCTDTPPGNGSYAYRAVASYATWTAQSSAAGPVAYTDTAAPTVSAEQTPSPNADGWNRTVPVTLALTAEDTGGSGVSAIKYTTDGSDPTSSGTAQVYSTALSFTTTTTVKYYAYDGAGNASAVATQLVKIDTGAPTNAITLSNVTGGAYKAGGTIYYRGTALGSFTLTNAVADTGASGPAASETAALSGDSAGWAHTPSRVSTPTAGPYVSGTFSWSAFTTTGPQETVTGTDVAGNATTTTLSFVNDSTAPTGGSVDATGLGGADGRGSTSKTLSIDFSPGTDAGSGLAASGAQLLRASASLSDGSCRTYGSYAQVGALDPAAPVSDTVPADHTCYRYRYVVSDRVGNQATYTSPDIEVDTVAPHPDFLQPITSPETVRSGPAGLDTGDIDNDGDQDIVTANIFDAAYASVLINNGVGDFRENLVVANAATVDAGLGHFDADANLDLVLLYQMTPPATGLLAIFKGTGDGTFTYMNRTNEIVSTGVRPLTLAVGDFNADAIDDVAVVNQQNAPATELGTVTTYLGNPAANDTFLAATPTQTHTVQLGASDIAYADFDGGARDLVVTNYASSSVSFLAGNGVGFAAPTHVPVGARVLYMDTAMLDAGGTRDIVATIDASNPSAVRTLFGNGAGGFPTQVTTAAATAETGAAAPQGIVADDFDNDADVDVAVANGTSPGISTLVNDGSGAFAIDGSSPELEVGAANVMPLALASADFDGSGYKDVAFSNIFTAPGEIRVLGNQNGTKADLSVGVTDSPDPVAQGQNVTYTVTATNAGSGTPSNVKATATLPSGVSFNAAASSPACSAAGTAPVTVTCDYGSVAPGAPESLQVVVTTGASTTSPFTTTFTVAGNLADPAPTGNRATTTTTLIDGAGPTGGSVDATGLVGTGGRYSTSTGLSIAFSKGTDPSGLAASGAKLRRSTAPLTSNGTADGSCGTFDASVQVGSDDPTSPYADTVPAGQACYRYEYVVADTLGNSTTYTSPAIKVDTTAPAAPTLAFSAMTNTHWPGGGSTSVYVRPTASSGSFTVTATGTDANSGIASYTMPTLGTGWSSSSGGAGVQTYSWSAANPTVGAGSLDVTATNNAGGVSPARGFTLISDTTAPGSGSVSYTDGYYGAASVSVSFTKGTDGGSGVNSSSGLLQRAEATMIGGTCGSFGAFATVSGGTDPATPFTDTSVTSGKCYQYRYLVSDNVGNQATYTSSNVAKVDTAAPTISRAVVAKTDGSSPGYVRQGGGYYVYADVTDAGSLASVTADTSSFDTGVTATTLSTTGGPWTIGGQSYSHRSGTLTADTGLTTGTSRTYTVRATDSVGNVAGPTSYTATVETYYQVITGTSGLLSYWRFDDAAIAADDFIDATGTVLSSHTGDRDATWTAVSGTARTAVITSADRLRKETGNGAAQYYASGTPASANYFVEADVYVASLLATDAVGIVGRQDVAADTYYLARHVRDSNRWELLRVINGSATLIGTGTGTGYYSETLTAGSTYRLGLHMNGTAISLTVNGVTRITATDSSITSAGRAGFRLGTGSSTAQPTDSTGLHLDDFRASTLTTTATDSAGTNDGTFTNGPLLNEPGALAGDENRSVRLDGVDDYVTVPHASTLNLGDGPLTLEAWVKRSSTTADGSIIEKGNSAGGAYELWITGSRLTLRAPGVGDVVQSTTTIADTGWHHVVATKSGATVKLYIDGVDRTGTVTNRTMVNNTLALELSGSPRFTGQIDEAAIYSSALTGATVLDHYRAGSGTG